MKKLTQDEIILKFKEVHGEKYDYTNINYVNNKVKVPIICPGHGIFWQSPHQHIAGHGCPVCGIKKRTKNITFSREKFIQKAQVIHGDKYDYSEVIYSNNKTKIKIICPIHGVFWQLPYTHLQGGGCLKCANNILTLEEIILKFREIHGEKYEYPIVKYFGLKHKITIICPIHGSFKQAAGLHLQGCGCPKCAKNRKLTQDEIILKFKEVHGEKYDYTNINYVNNKVKVPIICPGHGIFWQSPHQHIAGHGCPVCGIKKRTKNITFSREKFIQKAQVIHGDKYDYSEVIYSNNKTKIKIICPIHGVFWQLPYTHLQGGGCLKCANNILTLEEIILKFREIHGEKYEYPIVKYFGLKHKITIICPIHGSFKQAAGLHLQGCGCPKCAKLKFRSKGEIEMCEYIKSIYPGKVSENSRKLLGNGMELDVYLPELKLALEYNGDYWHKIREKDQPGYHENKRKLCNDKGIKLVEIWEKDWKKDNKNIKAKIATILEEIKINFQNIF